MGSSSAMALLACVRVAGQDIHMHTCASRAQRDAACIYFYLPRGAEKRRGKKEIEEEGKQGEEEGND